jgi:hypothetical protein
MSRTSTSIELAEVSTSTPLPITHPLSVNTKDSRPRSLSQDAHPLALPPDVVDVEQLELLNKRTTAVVLVTIVCVTMISSMLSGVTTIVLPTMARDLQLAPSVLLW